MLIRHFLQEPDMMIDGYFTPESANSTLPKIIDKLKMLAEIRGRLESEERENYGCVIKDIDSYLVDFPAKMFGDEVWLCWKLGEPKVMFWHPKDEGFLSRRPLEP